MIVRVQTFTARRRPSLISFQAVVRPTPAQIAKSLTDMAPLGLLLSPVLDMSTPFIIQQLCGDIGLQERRCSRSVRSSRLRARAFRAGRIVIGDCSAAVGGPCLRKIPALLKKVAAPISGLHLVRYCMGKRHLGDLGRESCSFGRPVAEC